MTRLSSWLRRRLRLLCARVSRRCLRVRVLTCACSRSLAAVAAAAAAAAAAASDRRLANVFMTHSRQRRRRPLMPTLSVRLTSRARAHSRLAGAHLKRAYSQRQRRRSRRARASSTYVLSCFLFCFVFSYHGSLNFALLSLDCARARADLSASLVVCRNN